MQTFFLDYPSSFKETCWIEQNIRTIQLLEFLQSQSPQKKGLTNFSFSLDPNIRLPDCSFVNSLINVYRKPKRYVSRYTTSRCNHLGVEMVLVSERIQESRSR